MPENTAEALNASNRYPRLSRLLGLMELLRNGHQRNARELAESLGVSRRTIFRDISTLQNAGAQVNYDAASQTYSLRTTFRTQATPAAFDAVSMACLLRKADTPELRQAAAIIETEIAGRLKAAMRDQLQQAMNWIVADLDEEFDNAGYQHLQNLFRCYFQNLKARITYQTAQDQSQSTLLNPSQLTVNGTGQTIVGYSSFHCETIGIPLPRILSVTATEDPFEATDRHFRVWRQE